MGKDREETVDGDRGASIRLDHGPSQQADARTGRVRQSIRGEINR